MPSHKVWNGLKLVIGKRGIRFSPEPSKRNRCIGREMRGKSYANRSEVHKAFESAAKKC